MKIWKVTLHKDLNWFWEKEMSYLSSVTCFEAEQFKQTHFVPQFSLKIMD